ncbi:MAG: Methyltransferase type 11 [Frankiales bacterium]|nr:Methyltransferase type 11 [Frankiales bacterium]
MSVPTVFDQLSVLADSTRSRLLLLLEQRELSVSELCTVVQLPQSTVSRHLKVLTDDGWVASRAEGPARHYRLAPDLDPAARGLWDTVRTPFAATPHAAADAARLPEVLAARASRSSQFFSTTAGRWDAVRADLFGASADLALLGLLDDRWTVGDLGCGTGVIAASLAPYVDSVVAVDGSAEMLHVAAQRLHGASNVDLRGGQLEQLPVADGELDAAVLFLVLHYVTDPGRALAEAGRALRPGGRLLIVDMAPHDRVDYSERMWHLWLGFDREQLDDWLAAAGLTATRFTDVPVDPHAKGPKLFAATARRLDTSRTTPVVQPMNVTTEGN